MVQIFIPILGKNGFMLKIRMRKISLLASLIVGLALCAGSAALVSAQGGAGAPNANSTPRELPIKHALGTKLTEKETRGAGVFFQHCALCHLDKTFGAGGAKYCCVRSLGPNLAGMFKDLSPDQEKALRDFIMNGGPTYMPAFKYGLTPKDIDDIIAYLKTLD
jgi:mono/diheme cytochrome c family protein